MAPEVDCRQGTPTGKVLDFLKYFKTTNDGLSPSILLTAFKLEITSAQVRAALDQLERDGRIKRCAEGIMITNGRWIEPGQAYETSAKLEFLPSAFKEAAQKVPTLSAAQREIAHLRAATAMHQADVERLERENARLHRLLSAGRERLNIRLSNRNQALEAENTHLKAELKNAVANWQRYANEVRVTRELFTFSKYAVGKMAVLSGEQRRDPVAALAQ